MPFTKDPSRLGAASEIHGSRSALLWHWIMVWNLSMRSRATTSAGAASSMIAIVRATVLDRASRSIVIMRAIPRADGTLRFRASASGAMASSFRRRVAHSVTTRSPPAKPAAFTRRHSAAPLRQPFAQSASSCFRKGSSEPSLLRKTSVRPHVPLGGQAHATCRSAGQSP